MNPFTLITIVALMLAVMAGIAAVVDQPSRDKE